MKVGEKYRERGPVGRKICGTRGEGNKKDEHQFPFHLLIISSCLIQHQKALHLLW